MGGSQSDKYQVDRQAADNLVVCFVVRYSGRNDTERGEYGTVTNNMMHPRAWLVGMHEFDVTIVSGDFY